MAQTSSRTTLGLRAAAARLKRRLYPRPPREISGDRGVPWLGSLVPFARDPLGYVERVKARQGDVAWFRLVEHELWMISDPALVEEVLVQRAKSFHKDAIYQLLVPVVGQGLVTSEDEVWRRHRKLAAPSFSRKHVDGYAAEMVRCTEAWIDGLGLATGGTREIDLHGAMLELTRTIVLHTLFGTDLPVGLEAVGDAVETVMVEFVSEAHGVRRVLPSFVPTPGRTRATAAIASLDETIRQLVAARRAAGLGDDLLSRLIAARDDDGGGFTDSELRDEAVTVFVAGHETTALALLYTFVLLGESRDAAARLVDEVRSLLGERAATAADLGRLPYTKAVVLESMRLLPPVWAIGREAQEDVTVGPHLIPKGAQVLICQWLLHRDERRFPDPLVFRPERWLDGLEDRLPRSAFLPFGGGPRVCIGNHFALLEAVLVLATIARRVDVAPTGPRPALVPSITLRPASAVPATVRAL